MLRNAPRLVCCRFKAPLCFRVNVDATNLHFSVTKEGIVEAGLSVTQHGQSVFLLMIKASFMVVWPRGPRRWIKAPVSSGAWVQIPPLPLCP